MSLVWLPCCHCGVSLEARGISDGCVSSLSPGRGLASPWSPGMGRWVLICACARSGS